MSAEAAEPQYGYARFKRAISDGNYGSIEASISLPFIVSLDETEGDTITMLNAKVAFIQAKTAICKELGIETKVLDDGTVMELLDPKATVVEKPADRTVTRPAQAQPSAQASAPTAPPPNGTADIGTKGPFKVFKRLEVPGVFDERNQPVKFGNPAWLEAQCAAAGVGMVGGKYELWDNRGKLPQFGGDGNHKQAWFRDKNGDASVWPPKGAPENEGTWRHPQLPAAAPGPYGDEEPF